MSFTFRKVAALSLAGFLCPRPCACRRRSHEWRFQFRSERWTSYPTANGTIAELPRTPGAPAPQSASVVSFDATGSGASSALFLNAGRANGGFGLAPGEGGRVTQAFSTAGGSASFSGSVLLDGVVMDSYDFGDGSSGPITLRGELDFTTTLAAGDHHFAAGIPPIWPGRGVSSQYFDNVSLDGKRSSAALLNGA